MHGPPGGAGQGRGLITGSQPQPWGSAGWTVSVDSLGLEVRQRQIILIQPDTRGSVLDWS